MATTPSRWAGASWGRWLRDAPLLASVIAAAAAAAAVAAMLTTTLAGAPAGEAIGTQAGRATSGPSESSGTGATTGPSATRQGAESAASSLTVWAVSDGDKIKRDDLQHARKARNAIWDGRRVHLVAARNEIVAFQLIVEAAPEGIDRLSAALPALTPAPTTERAAPPAPTASAIVYVAPAVDPTEYRDRPIQIFSQHYMPVTRGSRATWVFHPDSPSAPKDALGWVPVQLVPENATAGRGGFPLRVAPQQNQALWFDIYVGRDRAPGRYHGEITVTADHRQRRIPIELELLDVRLPDENSLRAMVYYQRDQPARYHGGNLDPAYHRFAKRHRVEFVEAYDPPRARAALGRFRGTDFSREAGYEGPGENVGNAIVPRTFYGPGALFSDPAQVWRAADEWMQFLDAELPRAFTFLYMPDEPRRDKFPEILALAERLRSNPGPGRRLPTLVTHGYTPDLAPAVDIWAAVPGHYDIARAASERAAGKQSWFYNGGRPFMGAIVIDAPATDPRVVGWAAFKHGADGYFYWHAAHWRHNSQKKIGDRDQNVWVNPITFDNRSETKPDQGFINGDGVLIYPGQERLHPDQDRGIAGPISTIQMANLRRGLQDHLLLTMARRAGANEVADRVVQQLVPRVLGEADPNAAVAFSEDGDAYEEARQQILRALAARATPPVAHARTRAGTGGVTAIVRTGPHAMGASNTSARVAARGLQGGRYEPMVRARHR